MGTEFDIRILRLTIQKNKVEYTYSKAISGPVELADSQRPPTGKFSLARDALSDETIKALIGQLTLLSDLIRDRRVKIDENELLGKLSNVVKVLGEHLYNVLFKGNYISGDEGGPEECLNEALKQVKLGLTLFRVELECKDQELAVWPWEYLYKPDGGSGRTGFLVNLAKQLVFNRILYQPGYSSKLETPRPVRVLLVGVQPNKFGPVQYLAVRASLRELQRLGCVELEEIIDIYPSGDPEKNQPDAGNYRPTATKDYFLERIGVKERVGVKPFDPHIIHFIGHGSSSEKTGGFGKMGSIGFVKEAGEVDWVDDSTFAGWLANSRSLKLVFLQACESALPDPYRSASGMAMQLAKNDIPAVIAMQYKIDNQTANKFALGFYRALAEGKSVDLAVKAGRADLDDGKEQQIYAFGLPVLYLRSYERLILPEDKKPAPSVPRESENTDEYHKCPRCETYQRTTIYSVCRNPECHLRFRCIFCKALFEDPLNAPYCPECEGYSVCQDCQAEFSKWNATIPAQSPLDLAYCIKCKPKYQQSSPAASYIGPGSHLPISAVTMHP
jgi:hypothetical protein